MKGTYIFFGFIFASGLLGGAMWTGCAEPLQPGLGLGAIAGGGDAGAEGCGDEICSKQSGESCESCPKDCGVCSTLSCEVGRGDCDGDSLNGCERALDTADNCGGCGLKCVNPNGQVACASDGKGGLACKPACAAGFAACQAAADGCTTDVSSDVDRCGGCNRVCSSVHAEGLGCETSVCKPTCEAGFADCKTPIAPAADDGCETDPSADPGEPNNACAKNQLISVGEGKTESRTGRILPEADVDTYRIDFNEASHICFFSSTQKFMAKITLASPVAGPATLKYNLVGCDNSWTPTGNTLCLEWGGDCAQDDSASAYLQIEGALSCEPYTRK